MKLRDIVLGAVLTGGLVGCAVNTSYQMEHFPALAAKIGKNEDQKIPSTEKTLPERLREVQETSPHLGDMYAYRNSKVPLRVYFCKERLFDKIFGSDPHDQSSSVEKNWDNLTKDYLTQWVEQVNGYLGYLSGGSFSLALTKIENGCPESNDGKSFAMVITPLPYAAVFGMYRGKGLFWLPHSEVTVSSTTLLHEMFHGLIGPHSDNTDSTNYELALTKSRVGLTTEEAAYLGWPSVTPVSTWNRTVHK